MWYTIERLSSNSGIRISQHLVVNVISKWCSWIWWYQKASNPEDKESNRQTVWSTKKVGVQNSDGCSEPRDRNRNKESGWPHARRAQDVESLEIKDLNFFCSNRESNLTTISLLWMSFQNDVHDLMISKASNAKEESSRRTVWSTKKSECRTPTDVPSREIGTGIKESTKRTTAARESSVSCKRIKCVALQSRDWRWINFCFFSNTLIRQIFFDKIWSSHYKIRESCWLIVNINEDQTFPQRIYSLISCH